jgi:N-ethylmaleimide reductase
MKLYSSFRLGNLELPNRIVMAPMTRCRAIGNVPNSLMRDYYGQRAAAGLIVTEGIAPSPNGLGYARIPGVFSAAQVEGWRSVTERVHAAGGHIFAQLMHTGRITHPHNMPPGARTIAPSVVGAAGTMYTDQEGPQPMPVPEAMGAADLRDTRDEFVRAAKNAADAGFDGIELHGANGYLLEQFLNPHTNRRDDAYGGSIESRARFVIEVAQVCAAALGPERVGIRLSPFSTFNDMTVHDEIEEQYTTLARALRGLAYVHLLRNPHEGFPKTLAAFHEAFEGAIMLNGGFDAEQAEATLAAEHASLVSFGRPFIANPDLVARMKIKAPLAVPDPSTFYTPGERGYTDYPSH